MSFAKLGFREISLRMWGPADRPAPRDLLAERAAGGSPLVPPRWNLMKGNPRGKSHGGSSAGEFIAGAAHWIPHRVDFPRGPSAAGPAAFLWKKCGALGSLARRSY